METAAHPDICVIGSGPAGLAAAEAAAAAGLRVLVAEQNPSLGRKFLMAGKSGLNLTKAEPDAVFAAAVSAGAPVRGALADLGPQQVMDWARGLGQEVFTGTSGRVFPQAMKASPLLRAWLARLRGAGVDLRTRWRWQGWQADGALGFETPQGPVGLRPGACVLALGGGSWARLGSDGAWTRHFTTVPFAPSNIGFRVAWSARMRDFAGHPVKPVALSAGGDTVRGEFVISAGGIEGSAVYALTPRLRAGAALHLDLLPDLSQAAVAQRLSRPRGKASVSNHLRKRLGLEGVRRALLNEAGPLPGDPAALAARIKAVPVAITGPNPIDQAISTAGGLPLTALGADFQLHVRPGVFAAGEMLDWDAPTGGYLITTCLATGQAAGRAAATHVAGLR